MAVSYDFSLCHIDMSPYTFMSLRPIRSLALLAHRTLSGVRGSGPAKYLSHVQRGKLFSMSEFLDSWTPGFRVEKVSSFEC